MHDSAIIVAQKRLALIEADAFGGQLMQVSLTQKDIFYQAPAHLHAEGTPRRGGVPVLFPQFAISGNFAKHGFARQMPWRIGMGDKNKPEISGQSWQASLMATSAAVQPYLPKGTQDWPHDAALELNVKRGPATLTVSLSVSNIGHTAFSFTGGLHPYFLWSKGDCSISSDDQNVNRMLSQNPAKGKVVDELVGTAERMQITMADRKLTLRKFGFKEWMLWNPGPGHSLADIAPDDWQHYVCLEPISVTQPHHLAPGDVFVGGFELTVSSI